MNLSMKDMVGNGKKVKFIRFRKGELIYSTENGFEFPVPLDSTGDGVLYAEDQAGLYMKYIRKQIKLAKEELEKN
jgi:hypothetical protein